MLKKLIFPSVLLLIAMSCGEEAPRVPTRFHFLWPANFVTPTTGPTTVLGARAGLTLVDYKLRTGTSAVAFTDTTTCTGATCATTERVTPLTVSSTNGAIVFALDRLLDGYSIETPVYRKDPVTNEDILGGEGDYQNQFKIILYHAPTANNLAYGAWNATTGVVTDAFHVNTPTSRAYLEYHPGGAWGIDNNTNTWEFPPPAIMVKVRTAIPPFPPQVPQPTTPVPGPASRANFPAASVIVVHLLAGVAKDLDGVPLPAAKNKAGQPVTLTVGSTTYPVAGTVVIKTP